MAEGNKRNDIQWLRALAILAVLGFHLWPKIFPHGFLGVDIFFVISGYLMTMILENFNTTLMAFYSRRIKRIFPTYLLVITVTLVLGNFLLLQSHFDFLKSEAIWSIFFVNNFYPMFHEKQYFELVSEYNFFVHTWSLGVEIQFYLLAPFLIKFILSKQKPIKWILIFGFASWLLQFLIPNESISFGFVFCRIWQFLCGTLAFCLSKYQNQKYFLLIENTDNEHISFPPNSYQKYTSMACIFSLGIITFSTTSILSFYLMPYFVRFACTALTGIFIVTNSTQSLNLPKFLDSVLVYIGNASYTIYLIHWPLIIYFRYFEFNNVKFLTLLLIFVSSIIIHEIFEKPVGNNSRLSLMVIVLCYLIIAAIYVGYFPENNKKTNINDFIKANEEEAKICGKFYYPNCNNDPLIEKYFKVPQPKIHHPMFKYCSIKLNSISNNSIMITGNSYAYFAIRGIMEAINQSKMKFSKVYFLARPACTLIVGGLNEKFKKFNTNPPCLNFDTAHYPLLSIVKPTVIISFSRIEYVPTLGDYPMNDTATDSGYLEVKKTLLHITNFTQKLIIIEPNPIFEKLGYKSPLTVAQTLLTNSSVSKFNVSIEHHRKLNDPSWNRIKEAVKHCQKCETISTEKIFCSEDFCNPVNLQTKLATFCDESHITPRTSLKFTSSILEALNNFYNNEL